jgi:hypothetical protein
MNETLNFLKTLYEQYKIKPLSTEEELSTSEDFKKGAEYGRSETLRKIIEYFDNKK